MIEFGNTLKAAREAKGLTIQQIAYTTRVMSSIIEDLEREDFSRIAAPIYGRGFVKLYCEAVGLDPKPMIAEFMEIYNGNRDLGIRERTAVVASTDSEPPVAEFEPAPEPLPEIASIVEPPPAQEQVVDVAPPLANHVLESPKSAIQPGLFDPPMPDPQVAPITRCAEREPAPMPDEPVYSRYATPLRNAEIDNRSWAHSRSPFDLIPPSFWRWSLVGIVAVVLVTLAIIGIRALYRATSRIAMPEPKSELIAPATAPTTVTQPAKPTAPRTPQEIPPLYMD